MVVAVARDDRGYARHRRDGVVTVAYHDGVEAADQLRGRIRDRRSTPPTAVPSPFKFPASTPSVAIAVDVARIDSRVQIAIIIAI